MTSNAVTPIGDLASRMPVVGKLRHGVYKSGRPQAIDTWRMTTSSRPFAESFAEAYGGKVEKMTNTNSPHDWEVISEATELSIALVPGGFQQSYELWSAGGCQRRCDGETVSVLSTTGPDAVEYTEAPCVCSRKGVLECSLKTRLTVVLPNLAFRGGLVYETSSENFAHESKGMIALIQQLQQSGITRGVLRLEKRKSSGNRKFTVAALGISESIDALQSGEVQRQSLGAAPQESRPELSSPPPEVVDEEEESVVPPADSSNPSDDDTVYEAEVVEDDETPSIVLEKSERAKMRAAFMARTKGLGLDYETQTKKWMEEKYGGGWSHLSDEQAHSLYHALIVPQGSQAEKDAAGERFKAAVLGAVAA